MASQFCTSRKTFLEFNKLLAEPISDEQGLEQGGVSSSDCYKLYNNELFDTVQRSKMGVYIGGQQVISAVGQADDTVLMSNDIHKLQHIFQLAQDYCQKFNVNLNSHKTKLLLISPPRRKVNFPPYNPINMKGVDFPFAKEV